jgi:hypothetical protein
MTKRKQETAKQIASCGASSWASRPWRWRHDIPPEVRKRLPSNTASHVRRTELWTRPPWQSLESQDRLYWYIFTEITLTSHLTSMKTWKHGHRWQDNIKNKFLKCGGKLRRGSVWLGIRTNGWLFRAWDSIICSRAGWMLFSLVRNSSSTLQASLLQCSHLVKCLY